MATAKEHLVKGRWADAMDEMQSELLDIRNRITVIRAAAAELDTEINASQFGEAADITLIANIGAFINAAAVTNFEAHIDATLPVL